MAGGSQTRGEPANASISLEEAVEHLAVDEEADVIEEEDASTEGQRWSWKGRTRPSPPPRPRPSAPWSPTPPRRLPTVLPSRGRAFFDQAARLIKVSLNDLRLHDHRDHRDSQMDT